VRELWETGLNSKWEKRGGRDDIVDILRVGLNHKRESATGGKRKGESSGVGGCWSRTTSQDFQLQLAIKESNDLVGGNKTHVESRHGGGGP